jgi:protein O-mannosyl-transferase
VSVVAFVLALMAKTSVVMLPVVMLLCAAWQRRRIGQKDIIHTLPFFVLALGFGLMSVWFQKYQALPSTELALQPASFAQRLAGAGFDFWFYLGKALFPYHLILQYPDWKIDPGTLTAYLPDLLVCVALGVCAWFHRTWGWHGLFALGCFGVMLFPSLGFFDAQFLTIWQVSDHLQYTALIAIVALVAAVMALLPNKKVFKGIAGVLVLASAALCLGRAEVFKSQESLMADTIAKNPEAAGAHNDLGIALAEKGNLSGAIDEFELAIKYDPENTDARVGLGHALMIQGKLAEAEKQYQDALKIRPHAPQTHKMYASLLRHEGRTGEALYHLRMAALFKPDIETYLDLAALEYSAGHPDRAVACLKQAVALRPDPGAMNNLAWILATCSDESVRNGKEAMAYALEACRLTNFKQAGMMGTLAAAYAEAGDFPEAVETAGIAANLAASSGNPRFAAANQQLMNLYRSGKPYHEKPIKPDGQ